MPEPPGATDPDIQAYDEESLLDRQHEWTLFEVDRILRLHRPQWPEPPARRLALLAVDEVVHYSQVPRYSPATADFARRRLEAALYDMENSAPVRRGALIWKLYNHGFVVRTSSVSFAFDLTRSWWGMSVDDPTFNTLAMRIIDQCDALFVSHDHGDHSDDWVIQAFESRGKPVIGPWGLDADGRTHHRVELPDNRHLYVVMYPGYQSDLICSVPIVFTPEGMSFAHTGDLWQSNSTPTTMWDWIDHVGECHEVDVLFVNCWVMQLPRVVRGFDPVLVITGHEDEVGHEINKRKPFFMSYDRVQDIEYPSVLMMWGESYYYRPDMLSVARGPQVSAQRQR